MKFQSQPLQSTKSVYVKQRVYDENKDYFKYMDSEDLHQAIWQHTCDEEVVMDVYDALHHLISY